MYACVHGNTVIAKVATVAFKCNVALACNSFTRLSKLVTLLSTIWYTHVYKIFEGQGLGRVTNHDSLKYADH